MSQIIKCQAINWIACNKNTTTQLRQPIKCQGLNWWACNKNPVYRTPQPIKTSTQFRPFLPTMGVISTGGVFDYFSIILFLIIIAKGLFSFIAKCL
jgi:hypothetical protein